eukprot:1978705-Amphidinium_carterae.1
MSGASVHEVVRPGTSARVLKEQVLPLLAERAQLDSIPDYRDYDCLLGSSTIQDDMLVEAWPGIQADAINPINLVGSAFGAAKHALRQGCADIALPHVKRNGLMLRWASEELRDTEVVVQAAVFSDGLALQFASQRLKNQHAILLLAVGKNGMALEFASEQLQNHYRLVLLAVQQNGMALQFASPELRQDAAITREACLQNPAAD